MGMFDYVRIDLTLLPITPEERADIEAEGGEFQTKSFYPANMWIVEITPQFKPGEPQLFRTSTYMTEERGAEPKELEVMYYTGVVNFYADGASGHWYEFNAEFKDGVLIGIERNTKAEAFFSPTQKRIAR